MVTNANLKELGFQLLPHPPTPHNYYQFASLKRVLHENRFGKNDEIMLGTEAFLEDSKTHKGIEILKKGWNEFITL